MAIGTGDSVRKFSGSAITLEASGAAIASADIKAADDSNYDLTSATYDECPHARFYGSFAYGTNPNNNGPVAIIIQALTVDGTNSEPDPTTSYQAHRFGPILVKAQTATQYFEVLAYNIPRKGKIWLLNQSGQQISSGWTLYMDPFAFGPNA